MFEPDLKQVLRPEIRPAAPARGKTPRDVEDAVFELITPTRTTAAGPAAAADFFPGLPPKVPDRVVNTPQQHPASGRDNGRLGVFAAGKTTRGDRSPARSRALSSAFLATVSATALLVFWMAGGYALFVSGKTSAPVAVLAPSADPTPTMEVVPLTAHRQIEAASQAVKIIRTAPRPPRIERAGSILMIRGGGG